MIEFNKDLWNRAEWNGKQRMIAAKGLKEKNPENYYPDKKHLKKETVGVLAEMLIWNLCKRNGIEFHYETIQHRGSLTEPEFYYKNKGYDVKGVDWDCKLFTVNKKAHENESKGVDYYIFVHVTSETTFRYVVVEKKEVDNWKHVVPGEMGFVTDSMVAPIIDYLK